MAMRTFRHCLITLLFALPALAFATATAHAQEADNAFEKLNNQISGAFDRFHQSDNAADKRQHLAQANAALARMRPLLARAKAGQDVGISADDLETYIAAADKEIARMGKGVVTVKAGNKSKTADVKPVATPWSIDDLKPHFARTSILDAHDNRVREDLKPEAVARDWARRELEKLKADREAHLFAHFSAFHKQFIRLMADLLKDAGDTKADKAAYNAAVTRAKQKVARDLERRGERYAYSDNSRLNPNIDKLLRRLAKAVPGDRTFAPALTDIERRLRAKADPDAASKSQALNSRSSLVRLATAPPLDFAAASETYRALQREYRTLLIAGPGKRADAAAYWNATRSRQWADKQTQVCRKLVALERRIVWTIGAPRNHRERSEDIKLLEKVSVMAKRRQRWEETDHLNALRQLYANSYPLMLQGGTTSDGGGMAQTGLDMENFMAIYVDPALRKSRTAIANTETALAPYVASRLKRGLERAAASTAFKPHEHHRVSPNSTGSFSNSAYGPLGRSLWTNFYNRRNKTLLRSCLLGPSGYEDLLTPTELGHFQVQANARARHLRRNIDSD